MATLPAGSLSEKSIIVIAFTELALPVAAMPLAQPGAKPKLIISNISLKLELVAYRRKFRRGGYWGGRHYGHNRYWGGRRYGYNRYGYGSRYGWNHRNNNWCRYGRCGYPYYKYRYSNYGWYNPWPWLAAGAVLGVAGSYYNDDCYYSSYGSSAHVRWCLNRYSSYDTRSDTYMGYDGYRHRCRAPY